VQTVCARGENRTSGEHGSAEVLRGLTSCRFDRKLGDAAGFLTGYYEPIVDGSRFPTGNFTQFRSTAVRPTCSRRGQPNRVGRFPTSGRAPFGEPPDGELAPYYDRGENRGRSARRPAPGNLLAAQRH